MTPSCAEGERLNPISARCEPVTVTSDMAPALADMRDDARDLGAPRDQGRDLTWPALDLGGEAEDAASDLPEVLPDLGPPAPQITRFLAVGDTGEGSETQRRVGQSMGRVCQARGGCEFALLLGDNAYDSGVESATDPFFEDIFVTPYGQLPFPFYVVLGNHDLGGDGLGIDLDFSKGDYQVAYSQINPQWLMPAKFYQVERGPLWLLALNTTEIFFGQDATQRGQIPDWIARAPADHWKIAFGHHPYISNGPHGNAGDYEGLPFVPIANGEHVQRFMDRFICGQIDLYICGHDHSLQDLKATCGTEFVVSGAGAKTTRLEGGNPNHFQSDEVGFLMVEATPSTLELIFFDGDGAQLHQRRITR